MLNKVFHNQELEKIDIGDTRFYRLREDKYLPSVTSKLDAVGKGAFFNEWLMNVGQNAKMLVEKAAQSGSNVHHAIESYLDGNEVLFAHEGKQFYSIEEWELFMKFIDFWERYKPELLASEVQVYNEENNYAGTIDLVCRLNGKVYLIDFKTSNALYYTYELQLSAYAIAWNEMSDVKIEETAIIWLKAATRTEGKAGAIQGKGWQLKTFDRHFSNAFPIYLCVNDLWEDMNPNAKPFLKSYPDRVSIKNAVLAEYDNSLNATIVQPA